MQSNTVGRGWAVGLLGPTVLGTPGPRLAGATASLALAEVNATAPLHLEGSAAPEPGQPPDAPEYGDLELYLASLSQGLTLTAPNIRN